MINVSTTGANTQVISQSQKSAIANEADNTLSKGSKKRKPEVNNSNNRLGVTDKSTNKSMSSSDIKTEIQAKKNNVSNQKLMRNKTVSLMDSNKKSKVKFKKDFVQIIQVESYKKYNVDMSYNEGETNESTKCRCIIF